MGVEEDRSRNARASEESKGEERVLPDARQQGMVGTVAKRRPGPIREAEL